MPQRGLAAPAAVLPALEMVHLPAKRHFTGVYVDNPRCSDKAHTLQGLEYYFDDKRSSLNYELLHFTFSNHELPVSEQGAAQAAGERWVDLRVGKHA